MLYVRRIKYPYESQQVAMMFANIQAKLDNLIQITETSKQTLGRIIAREVVKKSGSVVYPKSIP